MFSALQTPSQITKMRDQKKDALTNHGNPVLMYRSEKWHKQHPMKLQLQTSPSYPKLHTLNSKKESQNLVDNETNNPQAKLPVLKQQKQNTNITTVEMLIVLGQ